MNKHELEKIKAEIQFSERHQELDKFNHSSTYTAYLGLTAIVVSLFTLGLTIGFEKNVPVMIIGSIVLLILYAIVMNILVFTNLRKTNKHWITRENLIEENYKKLYGISKEYMDEKFKNKWDELKMDDRTREQKVVGKICISLLFAAVIIGVGFIFNLLNSLLFVIMILESLFLFLLWILY